MFVFITFIFCYFINYKQVSAKKITSLANNENKKNNNTSTFSYYIKKT